MSQTSTLWEITSEGENYLERTNERLEKIELPGMRVRTVTSAQLRERLRMLQQLKEHGPTLERDLPPWQHSKYIRERGWLDHAKVVEGVAQKALAWLRDRGYIAAVGGG